MIRRRYGLLDFGDTPKQHVQQYVFDNYLDETFYIVGGLLYKHNEDEDEYDMDTIHVSFIPLNKGALIQAHSLTGSVYGKYVYWYNIGKT